MLIVLLLVAFQSDPQPLPRMVATERAFAAATAEIGVRDGFLAFFADDALTFVPGADGTKVTVTPARPGLEARPVPKLPLAARLIWEPYTGQISSDGSLGWLTGGYANLTTTTREIVGQGAYFSVWKRQPNGTYRVWLDEGISLPDVWRDASPFRAAPAAEASQSADFFLPERSIELVEQDMSLGRRAWQSRLASSVRLHRDGRMPAVGREAAIAAMADWTQARYTLVRAETAKSGDLAITLGGYDAELAAGREHGTWVRVWQRDLTGHWFVTFETSKKTP